MINITVLMSTYNGERFLREQLDSIFSQEKVHVKLIVRDDGSSDRTLDILREYQAAHRDMLIISDGNNMRACASFLYLIRTYADDNYFALADQDDIWDADKLIIGIKAIQKLEEDDENIPLLYYSNLRIVDEDNIFARISHAVPHVAKNKYAALIENLATGCTVVYNKKLAQLAKEVNPIEYSMHDVWLYQTTSILGKTIYDFEPHINYRQHTDNVVGTSLKRVSWKKIKEIVNFILSQDQKTISTNTKALYEEFKSKLTEKDCEKFEEILNYKKNLRTKLYLIFDRDLWSDSFYRNVVFTLKVLLGTA